MKRLSRAVLLVVSGCIVLLAPTAAGGRSNSSGGKGKIVFVRDHLCRDGQDCGLGEIAVMNANGSGLKVLTHDEVTELSPRWSPDGRQIAYIRPPETASYHGARPQIWLMAADGRHQRALTRLKRAPGVWGITSNPSLDWAPNSRHIVFTAVPQVGQTQLYLANVRTGATKLLLRTPPTPGAGVDAPAWSPNGRWIAYTRGSVQIFLLSIATHRVHLLTNGMAPAWSPDSRRIAFTDGTLYVINTDGTQLRSLDVFASNPSWSRDGKWIVFSGGANNENGLAEIRPDGSGFHLISHLTPKWLNIQPDW